MYEEVRAIAWKYVKVPLNNLNPIRKEKQISNFVFYCTLINFPGIHHFKRKPAWHERVVLNIQVLKNKTPFCAA